MDVVLQTNTKIAQALIEMKDLIKFLYIESMTKEKNQTKEKFEKTMEKFLAGTVVELNSKYGEYIEQSKNSNP